MNTSQVVEAASKIWGDVTLDEDVRKAATAKVLSLIMTDEMAELVVGAADEGWGTPLVCIVMDSIEDGSVRIKK